MEWVLIITVWLGGSDHIDGFESLRACQSAIESMNVNRANVTLTCVPKRQPNSEKNPEE